MQGLSVSFRQYERGFRQSGLPVIQDLNVSVGAGELVAVVGSSGSGKSLLAHAVLGILPYNAYIEGQMYYQGQPLTPKVQKQLRGREIALIPQNVSYLDPLMKIGPQVRGARGASALETKSRQVLGRYGLPPQVEDQYPFELSGGMARRVLIATAVMESPRLIIADEPTPGLHLDIARRVLGHIRELADAGAGLLLITHDLELALEVADRILVFYAGTTVEDAAASDFQNVSNLRHPYTRALWRAMPQHGFQPLAGTQPYAGDPSPGCPFFPRCRHAADACRAPVPWRPLGGGYVRCVLDWGECEP